MADEGFAYVEAAKAMAMTVIDLLWDDAKELNEVKKNYKPVFSGTEAYLNYYDRLFGNGT